MDWQMLAWGRLADAAAGGLIVLIAGSLAVRLCRQPVRRARLVVLTVMGAIAVPVVSTLPVAPRWPERFLPATRAESFPLENAMAVMSDVADPPAPAESGIAREGTGVASKQSKRSVAPDLVVASSASARPGLPWRSLASWVRAAVLTCYCAVAAGLAAWWVVGQVVLWRVTRAARPAERWVRSILDGLAGPGGEGVLLLESDRIALPFTYTWIRPVILLPSTLCERGRIEALRYALAHEWSHVERRDAWVWNAANLGGLLLFYQPLFWWLRRQLRLCQDFLADARAAAAGSAEDYAAFLVELARFRTSDRALPALGIVDRRSNLSRRVIMLVQDHEPLEHGCRAAWSVLTASAAVAVIVVASGFHVSAAPPSAELKDAQNGAKAPAESGRTEEALHYTGTVVDKDTGKGIPSATVVVRRSLLRSRENRVLEESRHTTGADGTYTFTIPPEQVAEPHLYIELDVEHPDYATRAGFGYALSMTRKNEKLNERPFFERVEMRPARAVTGRIETPEGEPAAGVRILAYSRVGTRANGNFEYGSFARAKTDAEGRFRVPITTPGQGVIWVIPKTFAPEMHALADGKRGDIGTISLKKGVTTTGRLFDVQGKPLAGLFVEIERERGIGPDFEILNQLSVSDAIERTAETDAEGRFTFDPLPPGSYRVMPTETARTGDRSAGWTRRELPGVFTPTKLSISEGNEPAPLEIRASPHVVIEGRWLDSKGKPKGGWSSFVFGRADGSSWFGQAQPDLEGRFSLKVPHGLEQVEMHISTNEHASAEYRIGKDEALKAARRLKLGTLDHDVKDIEIVRYVAPIIVVNATTRDGRQVKDFKAAMEYTGAGTDDGKDVSVVGGGKKESIQDEQYDGRYRSSCLLPDREVNVTVSAEGFSSGSRKLTLSEGKVEEITFVLEPK